MRSSILFIALLGLLASTFASSGICGAAGMSGGSGSISGSNQVAALQFAAGTSPSGSSLTIANNGAGKPYHVEASSSGPVRITLAGTFTTTCSGYGFPPQIGSVYVYDAGLGVQVPGTYYYNTASQSPVAFALEASPTSASASSVYEVRIATGASSCSVSISNAVLEVDQFVCGI